MARWLGWSLVALVIYGVWGIVSALASQPGVLTPFPLQVFSTLGLVPIALALLFSRNLRTGKNFRRGMTYAFGAGVCGSLGNVALSAAILRGGQASIVYPLTALYPLVTVVLARILLKERLNRIQLLGMALALAALVLSGIGSAGAPEGVGAGWWPQTAFAPWMAYALLTLVLFGITQLLQKFATNTISNELSTVCFATACGVIAALIVAASDGFTWRIPGRSWALALGYGALLGVGTLTLFAAYRWGKAGIVTAITALYPALTVLLAVPILGETLNFLKIVMIALSLGAGVALSQETPAPAQAPARLEA